MDVGSLIGIALGFGLVAFTVLRGGASSFFMEPNSILIVFGGTIAATLVNFPLPKVLGVVKVAKRAFLHKMPDSIEVITTLVALAKKARVDGVLALEQEVGEIDDEFLQKGVRQLIDGTDPELVRNLLNTELISLEERHALGQRIFKTMGAFSPAFGMLGTLMGLIAMLSKLNDPTQIGVGMAIALVTTFYGVFLANLVFLPIAGKLKARSEQEIQQKQLIIEGITSIQAGDNPRVLNEKLVAFLAPAKRAMPAEGDKATAGAKERVAA